MNRKLILVGMVVIVGLGAFALYSTFRTREAIVLKEPLGVGTESAASVTTGANVELGDGDTYELGIRAVKKDINGREVRMLAYNGSIPGPTLRVPEGGAVTIRLKNEGDIATTLHAHGVRMDNAFDGVPEVTQKEIAPGESFTYQLEFPDPGIFWYHPHVRTDYALESGLYGNIIVSPKDATHWGRANREAPWIIDDIALDQDGILPFDRKRADHTLMGRFGNVMLINGETEYQLSALQGEVIRLYLTNAANTRLFNVAIPGAKMKLVGADLGRYARETFVDEVLIAPGERRVVEVLFERSGAYPVLHRTPGKNYTLGKVVVTPEKAIPDYATDFQAARTNVTVVNEMDSLMTRYLNQAPAKSLRLSLNLDAAMQGMMGNQGGHMGGGHMMDDGTMMSGAAMGMGDDGDSFEWEDTMAMMNQTSNAESVKWELIDMASGKSNMNIDDWNFIQGERAKIRIFNDPKSMHPMQHPIHFHGQRFLILATNGERNQNPVWMDTALVAKGDTVDLLLEASNPGTWMVHCHILEHAESGMMFTFKVQEL